MKNKKVRILAISIILAMAFPVARFLWHAGDRIDYRHAYVSRVIDGDTVELSNGERLRYIGIDTPERNRKDDSGEWVYLPMPYAEAASDFNKRLIEGRPLRLEFDVQKEINTIASLLMYTAEIK